MTQDYCKRCRKHKPPQASSWSNIQQDLLIAVLDRLKLNYDELLKLRSVCKGWRSIIRLIPLPPFSLSPFITLPTHQLDSNKVIDITASAVYVLRRLDLSWLVTIEQWQHGKFRLLHPFTGYYVSMQNTITNFEAIQVSKSGFGVAVREQCTAFKGFLYKVWLWADPKVDFPTELKEHHSFMILEGSDENSSGKLTRYRLKDLNDTNDIKTSTIKEFDDMIYWRKLIYVVDRYGRLYGVDYNDANNMRTCLVNLKLFTQESKRTRKRLLEFDGELYLVVMKGSYGIKVYKLDELLYEWKMLTSLEDRILFVRSDICFMVRARDLPGCQKNCVVYIIDTEFDQDSEDRKNAEKNPLFQDAASFVEVRVYNYGDRMKKFKLISECPGFSSVLWPPPKWILAEN